MQLLRKLAFPISLVYALVVHIRNVLYNRGILKSTSFKTPTICVGNLSVGGTGKTPMIEYLVSRLQETYKVAVLSRGYKRRSKGFQIASDASEVQDLGDEPYQIFRKFPEITVAVDADRCNGIAHLEKSVHPQIVLLDDAFQHRKVTPGFSILLTAYDDLYSRDWYLPTGNLRDSKREARRADVIIVTKCPDTLDDQGQARVLKSLKPQKGQEVLFSQLKYDDRLKGDGDPLTLDGLLCQKVTLVTGIANPKPLVAYLTDRGLDLEHLEFRDHHFFSTSEIGLFNSKPIVLTTEKDFARLKGKVANLYYIQVKHGFIGGGGAVLEKALRDFMQ